MISMKAETPSKTNQKVINGRIRKEKR